jgi:hypothetical protein
MTSIGWIAGVLVAAVIIAIKFVRARRVSSDRRGLGL